MSEISTSERTWSGEVRLSYADYERWSRGKVSPADLIAFALQHAISRGMGFPTTDVLDLARLARQVPGIDGAIAAWLSEHGVHPTE